MRKRIAPYALGTILAFSMTAPVFAMPTETIAEAAIETEELNENATSETASTEEATIVTASEAEGEVSEIQDEISLIQEETEKHVITTAESEEESQTEDNPDDDIQIVTDESRLDEEGRLSVEVQMPEDAAFPYAITLSGPDGEVSFEISYNGQILLIKPGTYKVKKVRNGDNKKLDKGAQLVITEDTDAIYLDFTKPNQGVKFNIVEFILSNVVWLLLAAAGFFGLKKYCDYIGIKR